MIEHEKENDKGSCKADYQDNDNGSSGGESAKRYVSNNIDNNCAPNDDYDEDSSTLSDCGCCQGIEKITPIEITNPPGLSTIKYRVGTHSQFKSSMIVNLQKLALVRGTTLVNLTTRENDDLAIALLDGWATIADVLTFYQERIANEGFLRTAKDRRSIVELSRSIGYELRPGVAASVSLAFVIDADTTSDEKIKIPIGTKAQSMPSEGKMPQTFETVEEIEAHHEWNELTPRLYQPQKITTETTRFYFKGTNTLLKKGDMLLVLIPGTNTRFSTIVSEVQEDPKFERTIVDVLPPPTLQSKLIARTTNSLDDSSKRIRPDQFDLWLSTLKITKKMDPSKITIGQAKQLTSYKWSRSDLNAIAAKYGIQLNWFFKFINKIAGDLVDSHISYRVFTFRIKAGVFGHNAPRYDTLPLDNNGVGGEARSSYEKDRREDRGFPPVYPRVSRERYPYDVKFAPVMRNKDVNNNWFELDNLYDEVLPTTKDKESWVVLSSHDVSNGSSTSFQDNPHAYQIKNTREGSISRYLVTAKVTSLELDARGQDLSAFKVRSTTVFAKGEQLELADLPITDPIRDRSVTLSRAVENELRIGQRISISGEILDKDNISTKISSSEIATISNIELDGIYTTLVFNDNLDNIYKRDTVVINANIAAATHGETMDEILGSGNPMQGQQLFYLKQKPLTYLSAATPSGIKNSLQIRIDGILWNEVPFLYGRSSNDKVYVVRIQDKGEEKIVFGDNLNGTKPPAGSENIKATYRVGIGLDGLVEPGKIKLLASRPFGVQSVTNPIESSGADDPENLEDARVNATLNVLTLDRIVSIRDTENFALAFAGIGKAHAKLALNNENRVVIRLTIASATGDIVDKESELCENLLNAIKTYSHPAVKVSIEEFEKILFNIEAKIAVSEDRIMEEVFGEVIKVLLDGFSFRSRQFLKRVTISEVVSIIHTVNGVVAVDLDYLYTFGKDRKRNDVIPEFSVQGTTPNSNRTINEFKSDHDWLVMINPDGIKLSRMQL